MNFMDHSRSQWSRTSDPAGYPGDEEIKIGCLQRIALALEKMAEHSDPLWRAKRLRDMPAILAEEERKEKESAEADREWNEWNNGPGKLYDQLGKRISDMVKPSKTGNPWKIEDAIRKKIGLECWVGSGKESRRITREELEECQRKLDAYDMRNDDLSWLAEPGKFKYADRFRTYVASLPRVGGTL